MRILVCGGRNYHNRARINRVLLAVEKKHGIDAIIQGAANGADRWAAEWGWDNKKPVCSYPAQWDEHGNKAGPIRNFDMLKNSSPDAVIAFPGGTGTAHMVRIAKRAGLPVWEVKD